MCFISFHFISFGLVWFGLVWRGVKWSGVEWSEVACGCVVWYRDVRLGEMGKGKRGERGEREKGKGGGKGGGGGDMRGRRDPPIRSACRAVPPVTAPMRCARSPSLAFLALIWLPLPSTWGNFGNEINPPVLLAARTVSAAAAGARDQDWDFVLFCFVLFCFVLFCLVGCDGMG